MMRFLRLNSLLLVLLLTAACTQHPYRHLATDNSIPAAHILSYQPHFSRELYRCVVDGRIILKKFHLSGVLFFKQLPDSSTRVVFQNEMGISFFDFSWDRNDSFKVISILEQLDKPALIKTLKKDFELVLMKHLDTAHGLVYMPVSGAMDHYYHFPLEKGYAYYLAPASTASVTLIRNYGKRKVISIAESEAAAHQLPDSIFIRHHKANFTISLKKITENAE